MFILIEMAKNKHDISNLLESKTNIYINHLMKLYFYRNHKSKEYWISEILSFLSNIPRMKNNKRIPSFKFIYEHLYGWISENIEGIIGCFIEDNLNEDNPYSYGTECLNYTQENCKKFIEDYFESFINCLIDNKGVISRTRISDIINCLLIKYK